eukprot:COSAG02_NODE_964_length_15595_cov_7.284709_10_plen_70_part_00
MVGVQGTQVPVDTFPARAALGTHARSAAQPSRPPAPRFPPSWLEAAARADNGGKRLPVQSSSSDSALAA